MPHIENWFGTIAAICTTTSFIPQGISLAMYSLFTLGIGLWLVYGTLIHSAPVYLSNGATLILAGTILVMKCRLG